MVQSRFCDRPFRARARAGAGGGVALPRRTIWRPAARKVGETTSAREGITARVSGLILWRSAALWSAGARVTRRKVRAPEAAASSVCRQARERTIPRRRGPIRCGARTHGRPNFPPQPAGPSRGVARTFRRMDHLNFTPGDTSDRTPKSPGPYPLTPGPCPLPSTSQSASWARRTVARSCRASRESGRSSNTCSS
jgi:hypothetical protein